MIYMIFDTSLIHGVCLLNFFNITSIFANRSAMLQKFFASINQPKYQVSQYSPNSSFTHDLIKILGRGGEENVMV